MSSHELSRRSVIGSIAVLAFVPPVLAVEDQVIHVTKSPTCGCCGAWVDHMRDAGFTVEVTDAEQKVLQNLKVRLSIQPEQASCHTARVGDYFIEGHVPAGDVKRLLAERPAGLGLAVPGMPIGSPGMEMGGQRDPYDVLLIRADRKPEIFQAHR